ncbi:Acid phosphatase 1 [Triticum urartu]|uniref:Acid phosphatase 1 n=1 Tax=Triticum urartu TaxID=4572 RepID=M8AJA6_TRIUA|nr:Acid phosphatase 1 [Triticum urartu]
MDEAVAPLIHALRPMLGSGGQLGSRAGVACDSWRLGVEAHNVRDRKRVPASCEGYVGHCMLGGHYHRDSKLVIDQAISYIDSIKLSGNGKEVLVFDIDETTLSNLPYYATQGFGFQEYARQASAPALPETKRLYNKLLSVGIKLVILTGRREVQRTATVTNLRRQGFSGWMTVLLKPADFKGSTVTFKSSERQKLLDAGYIIVGNIGDQWSDILGTPEGARTFKLPDPIYVGHYMLGGHYRRDSKLVIDEAISYIDSLKLAGNGKEVWVFDVDETTLSNLPYYATHGFGATPYNWTSFQEYARQASAPALPETKRLFDKLLSVGIKPVILTGRREVQRTATVTNLRRQGFSGWMTKLLDAGYIIVGNIGDQWSDILSTPEGARTFKLPDPMYYIG